ncbi:unnamed protein product [Rotaria sp. Silwood1]|nr:unnamed protein product [Rotaria sp. Silwood1]CAF1654876.1 unnamed protein product [Rotaria sp. Silwood1]CAF5009772.1 unnamed protein product [Rotaria sp. Silwood1]
MADNDKASIFRGQKSVSSFSSSSSALTNNQEQPKVSLILSPTFELALQIGQVIAHMVKFLPYIKIAFTVRDPTISKRNEYIKGKVLDVPIVIGAPGTR